MISIFICDPKPYAPEFDFQVWTHFPWKGTAIPLGKSVGEWAWVGRIDQYQDGLSEPGSGAVSTSRKAASDQVAPDGSGSLSPSSEV